MWLYDGSELGRAYNGAECTVTKTGAIFFRDSRYEDSWYEMGWASEESRYEMGWASEKSRYEMSK